MSISYQCKKTISAIEREISYDTADFRSKSIFYVMSWRVRIKGSKKGLKVNIILSKVLKIIQNPKPIYILFLK